MKTEQDYLNAHLELLQEWLVNVDSDIDPYRIPTTTRIKKHLDSIRNSMLEALKYKLDNYDAEILHHRYIARYLELEDKQLDIASYLTGIHKENLKYNIEEVKSCINKLTNKTILI